MKSLTKLGLDDLITTTPDAYVEAALRLAGDQDRIISLRKSLRKQVEKFCSTRHPM
jgi:predicted O-linked N-acetylglucosamine transferase (SPINDLY family)